MTKKVYVGIEIVKILVLNWFLGMVYNASVSSNNQGLDLTVIGFTFLIMLGTLILSSIVLEILLSFFTPQENFKMGEWEKMIDKNVLRNFAYMLSIFLIAIMISFALGASQETIILLLRIGFFSLIAINNLSKAYYYVG